MDAKLEFKVQLWNHIMDNIRPRRKINDSQLAIRCPFCGDSVKNPQSTHFYIKINMREDEPILFHCFRCDVSGILTPSVLRSLDLNNLHLNSALISYNNYAVKNKNYEIVVKDNELDFKVPIPDENDERNIKKKEYIENRLGIKTTFEELAGLKTILKLGQFLKYNKIEKITVSKEKAIMLHEDYVGFLTTRNEFINFRQVFPNNKGRRYEKYSIFNNLDNTRKFYTIPNEIDILSNKKITINIAEGVFDILGIYYHIYEKERKNMIYTAACGSGFISVLKYFIKMGVFGNVKINIYSDSDRNVSFYKPLVKELKPWVDDFKIYYNELSKDYGVTKDEIRLVKKKI